MTKSDRKVLLPPAQLEIVSKHFNKLGTLNDEIKAQQEQLTDIFKLIDSVYNTRLADGIDTLDMQGNVIFGEQSEEAS
jgi:hypothetical protein